MPQQEGDELAICRWNTVGESDLSWKTQFVPPPSHPSSRKRLAVAIDLLISRLRIWGEFFILVFQENSEAGEPPQFQGKRSRGEKAIFGALGKFRGILGAALGVQKIILGMRNPILGMASHD